MRHSPAGLPPATVYPSRIDPTLAFLEIQTKRYGRNAPAFGRGLGPAHSLEGTAALLCFERLLRAEEIKGLESHGVAFAQQQGTPVRIGRIYSAWVPFSALDTLRNTRILRRAEATWSPFILQPLEKTTSDIGAIAVRSVPALGFDGSGVLIADIDSGIDPTHPHFFRADGGYYSWIDVNMNGVFDVGVDAVDLNRNGEANTNETLRLLDAGAVHAGRTENSDDVFQASLDWLFADQNGDRVRNLGVSAGFAEEDLAWGEPIFVIDDVNGNDRLDPHELLVRLGSSKVRAMITQDAIYEREKNLITAPDDPNVDYVYHGTGVASILLGGQSPHGRRGVAPGAELLAYATWDQYKLDQNFDTHRQFNALADALDRGAKIVLHEWTDPFRAPQDGSTLFEEAMTSSRVEGAIHVTPVGNLNLSGKHIEITTAAALPTFMPFTIPDATDDTIDAVFGSLIWAGQPGTLEVSTPSGTRTTVTANGPVQIEPGVFVQLTSESTPRGNTHIQFLLWQADKMTLPTGPWAIHINVPHSTVIHGRITDYFSGWGPGVGWKDPTTNRGTLAFPSTADVAIGVGAYAGRWERDESATNNGALRDFSGRGPRMDGALALDLSAPDDPFAAISATSHFLDAGYERQWLATFGGTSGAAPHVAGALALLMQAFPLDAPDALEQRLFTSAKQNGLPPSFGTTFPNASTGYGRLDIFAALSDQPRPPATNKAPSLEAFVEIADGESIINVVASDPDGDEIWYRYDYDYDGKFDTEWTQEPLWRGPQVEARFARIEARDVFGASRGTLVEWQLPMTGDMGSDAGSEPDPPLPDDCDGCGTTSPSNGLLWLLAILGFGRKRRISRHS